MPQVAFAETAGPALFNETGMMDSAIDFLQLQKTLGWIALQTKSGRFSEDNGNSLDWICKSRQHCRDTLIYPETKLTSILLYSTKELKTVKRFNDIVRNWSLSIKTFLS